MAIFGELVSGLTMRWAQGGAGGANVLGAGLGAITFSPAIQLIGADQLGIEFANLLKPAGSTTLRVQWGSELTITDAVNYPWIYEQSVTFVIAAGVATYTAGVSEWSLTGTGAAFKVLLPAVAHFCRVGVYASAVAAFDTVQCSLTRLSGGNTQGR